MNLEITYPSARIPANVQAGEPFAVTLTGLGALVGTVSLRWWRVGRPDGTNAVEIAWDEAGVTLGISEYATRYMDGQYHWAVWFTPSTGSPFCWVSASSLFVSISGGQQS